MKLKAIARLEQLAADDAASTKELVDEVNDLLIMGKLNFKWDKDTRQGVGVSEYPDAKQALAGGMTFIHMLEGKQWEPKKGTGQMSYLLYEKKYGKVKASLHFAIVSSRGRAAIEIEIVS